MLDSHGAGSKIAVRHYLYVLLINNNQLGYKHMQTNTSGQRKNDRCYLGVQQLSDGTKYTDTPRDIKTSVSNTYAFQVNPEC